MLGFFLVVISKCSSLLLGSTPLICGGYHHGSYEIVSACHAYSPSADSWAASTPLPTALAWSAEDSHPDWGMVLAGGFDELWLPLQEVYATRDGGATFEQLLPPMPVRMAAHCAVIIDSNRLFVLGADLEEEGLAYLYDRSEM